MRFFRLNLTFPESSDPMVHFVDNEGTYMSLKIRFLFIRSSTKMLGEKKYCRTYFSHELTRNGLNSLHCVTVKCSQCGIKRPSLN